MNESKAPPLIGLAVGYMAITRLNSLLRSIIICSSTWYKYKRSTSTSAGGRTMGSPKPSILPNQRWFMSIHLPPTSTPPHLPSSAWCCPSIRARLPSLLLRMHNTNGMKCRFIQLWQHSLRIDEPWKWFKANSFFLLAWIYSLGSGKRPTKRRMNKIRLNLDAPGRGFPLHFFLSLSLFFLLLSQNYDAESKIVENAGEEGV